MRAFFVTRSPLVCVFGLTLVAIACGGGAAIALLSSDGHPVSPNTSSRHPGISRRLRLILIFRRILPDEGEAAGSTTPMIS